jgi:hypothetical protein
MVHSCFNGSGGSRHADKLPLFAYFANVRGGLGLAIFLGKFVILSVAKNLAKITKILRCAQNDRIARIPCHIRGFSNLVEICGTPYNFLSQ